MTETTIIPVETQVQPMLESPMTDSEIKQLSAVESRSFSAGQKITVGKIDRARCLMEVYQDKLFRGKTGGRTWGQYLKSIDLAKLGYDKELDTDLASREIMYGSLCDAIDRWNNDNLTRPPLPYPKGPSCMQGWALLFDRVRSGGNGTGQYAAFGSCDAALDVWKTAVFKNDGQPPSYRETIKIGRAARDAGLGRPTLTSAGSPKNLKIGEKKPGAPRFQPDSQPRTVSTQSRMEAAAAQSEREKRQSEQKAEEKSLREDGIDPRLISKMDDGPEIDAMAECETYCTQLNQLQQDVQRIESWVTGRLNLYGSEGMDALRQVDAGIYTINDDVKAISSLGLKLLDLSELLSDVVLPGDLSSSSFEAEPTA